MVIFIDGILKIANLILAVIAAFIGIGLFKSSFKNVVLKAWKPMAVVLVLFAVQEILGAFRAFAIYESPFLTHVNVSIILAVLIYALVQQISVTKIK